MCVLFIEPLLQKGGAEWFCDQVPSITSMAFTHPSEIGQVPRTAEVHGLRRSTQATGTDIAAFRPEAEAGARVSTPVIQIEGSDDDIYDPRQRNLPNFIYSVLNFGVNYQSFSHVVSPSKFIISFWAPHLRARRGLAAICQFCSCPCCCLLGVTCVPVFFVRLSRVRHLYCVCPSGVHVSHFCLVCVPCLSLTATSFVHGLCFMLYFKALLVIRHMFFARRLFVLHLSLSCLLLFCYFYISCAHFSCI